MEQLSQVLSSKLSYQLCGDTCIKDRVEIYMGHNSPCWWILSSNRCPLLLKWLFPLQPQQHPHLGANRRHMVAASIGWSSFLILPFSPQTNLCVIGPFIIPVVTVWLKSSWFDLYLIARKETSVKMCTWSPFYIEIKKLVFIMFHFCIYLTFSLLRSEN